MRFLIGSVITVSLIFFVYRTTSATIGRWHRAIGSTMAGREVGRQNPADALIRELIGSGRAASSDDIVRIVQRIATAPFDPAVVRVPEKHRGLTYAGRTLGGREESLFYHLVKRILIEEQWTQGTTPAQYLEDLRQGARSRGARVVIYRRRGGPTAAVLAPNPVPTDRLGRQPLPFIYVVYAPERSTIITGYQTSGPHELSIPGDARWLR